MAIVVTRSERTSSATGSIIIASIAAWLIQLLSGQTAAFTMMFGFVPTLAIDQQHLWQLASHLFLHGGFFHLLFTMLVLHAFGRPLEQKIGKVRFTLIFLLSGAGAALLHGLTAVGDARLVPLVGAAGAVFGIAAAYIRVFPRSPALILWFLPVRAWSLLLFLAIFELLNGMGSRFEPLAFLVHCSGILTGTIVIELVFSSRRRTAHAEPRKKTATGPAAPERPTGGEGTVINLEKGDDGLWR